MNPALYSKVTRSPHWNCPVESTPVLVFEHNCRSCGLTFNCTCMKIIEYIYTSKTCCIQTLHYTTHAQHTQRTRTHACTKVRTHAHTQTHPHIHRPTNPHTHTHACMHTRTHRHTHTS